VASIWEVIAKVQPGTMSPPRPAGSFITSELAGSGVQILPVTLDHLSRVESLDPHHRDPFDRMLVAQSIEENLPVVTADPSFKCYPVQEIWDRAWCLNWGWDAR
jgi:PIN domain nuclease of toxin-antitoxin system